MSNITDNDGFQQRLDDATRKVAGSAGSTPAESSEKRDEATATITSHGVISVRPMPTKPRNADVRSREHLTPDEVEKLIKAAGSVGRHRNRDRTLILMAFRHGFRVAEIRKLRWDQINHDSKCTSYTIYIARVKRGTPSIHHLSSKEIRGINRIKKEQQLNSVHIFTSERGGQLSDSSIRAIVARAGRIADLGFPCHPHMLRHACGYKLAADGVDTRAIQAYLGHRQIQCTVRYTELAPGRFDGLWDD